MTRTNTTSATTHRLRLRNVATHPVVAAWRGLALFAAALCCDASEAVAPAPAATQPDAAAARATVQRAFDAVLAAGGFRGYAQGRVFGPGSPVMTGDIDVVLPDRIRASTDNLEFVAIGDRAWLSTMGLWAPVDRDAVPATAFDLGAMRRAIASIRDVQVEGTAKAAQCATHVYRFHASGNLPGAPANGDLRVWICDGDGRPARLEATDARTRERVIFDFDWQHRPDVRAPTG